jgi:hypothetical protein
VFDWFVTRNTVASSQQADFANTVPQNRYGCPAGIYTEENPFPAKENILQQ